MSKDVKEDQSNEWETALMLGGEIIDFEGDLRRDGIDKLKAFIVSVRQDGYKEGKHETLITKLYGRRN